MFIWEKNNCSTTRSNSHVRASIALFCLPSGQSVTTILPKQYNIILLETVDISVFEKIHKVVELSRMSRMQILENVQKQTIIKKNNAIQYRIQIKSVPANTGRRTRISIQKFIAQLAVEIYRFSLFVETILANIDIEKHLPGIEHNDVSTGCLLSFILSQLRPSIPRTNFVFCRPRSFFVRYPSCLPELQHYWKKPVSVRRPAKSRYFNLVSYRASSTSQLVRVEVECGIWDPGECCSQYHVSLSSWVWAMCRQFVVPFKRISSTTGRTELDRICCRSTINRASWSSPTTNSSVPSVASSNSFAHSSTTSKLATSVNYTIIGQPTIQFYPDIGHIRFDVWMFQILFVCWSQTVRPGSALPLIKNSVLATTYVLCAIQPSEPISSRQACFIPSSG